MRIEGKLSLCNFYNNWILSYHWEITISLWTQTKTIIYKWFAVLSDHIKSNAFVSHLKINICGIGSSKDFDDSMSCFNLQSPGKIVPSPRSFLLNRRGRGWLRISIPTMFLSGNKISNITRGMNVNEERKWKELISFGK